MVACRPRPYNLRLIPPVASRWRGLWSDISLAMPMWQGGGRNGAPDDYGPALGADMGAQDANVTWIDTPYGKALWPQPAVRSENAPANSDWWGLDPNAFTAFYSFITPDTVSTATTNALNLAVGSSNKIPGSWSFRFDDNGLGIRIHGPGGNETLTVSVSVQPNTRYTVACVREPNNTTTVFVFDDDGLIGTDSDVIPDSQFVRYPHESQQQNLIYSLRGQPNNVQIAYLTAFIARNWCLSLQDLEYLNDDLFAWCRPVALAPRMFGVSGTGPGPGQGQPTDTDLTLDFDPVSARDEAGRGQPTDTDLTLDFDPVSARDEAGRGQPTDTDLTLDFDPVSARDEAGRGQPTDTDLTLDFEAIAAEVSGPGKGQPTDTDLTLDFEALSARDEAGRGIPGDTDLTLDFEALSARDEAGRGIPGDTDLTLDFEALEAEFTGPGQGQPTDTDVTVDFDPVSARDEAGRGQPTDTDLTLDFDPVSARDEAGRGQPTDTDVTVDFEALNARDEAGRGQPTDTDVTFEVGSVPGGELIPGRGQPTDTDLTFYVGSPQGDITPGLITVSQAIDLIFKDFTNRWPQLAEGWNHATQTEFPNQPFTRPDVRTEWVSIRVEVEESELVEIGRQQFRRFGLVNLGYRATMNGGLNRVAEIQDKLLDWAELAKIPGVRMLDQPFRISTPGPDLDGWYRVSAVVPFAVDYRRLTL